MSTNPTTTSPNSSTSAGPCCLAEAVAEFEAAARTLCSMSANANEHMRDAVSAAYLSLELPDVDMHDDLFIAAALAKAVTAVLAQDDTRNARIAALQAAVDDAAADVYEVRVYGVPGYPGYDEELAEVLRDLADAQAALLAAE